MSPMRRCPCDFYLLCYITDAWLDVTAGAAALYCNMPQQLAEGEEEEREGKGITVLYLMRALFSSGDVGSYLFRAVA